MPHSWPQCTSIGCGTEGVGAAQGDIRSASCLLICQMKCRANGANGLPIIVALMASVHANRPWQSRPAVPAMRCSGSCYKANGAAGRIAAALVLMRATRLSPGRTQAAAEPTARPTAAAVSTDSNENGRICVGGLGPDAGSVCRRPERQRPDARHQSRTPRAPDAVRSQ